MVDVSVPTTMRTRLPDGRLLGVDGSVWLVRKVPLEPVVDAKSVQERVNAFVPLMAAYDELAAMANITGGRRALARSSYRQHQLLMVNMERLYNPPPGHPIADYLKRSFHNQVTEKRILLFMVRLQGKVGGTGGLKEAIDSVVETILVGGTPLSDFDADMKKVDSVLARCGLSTPSSAEVSIANAWWNKGHFPDTVELPHSDHLHIFSDAKAVRMADTAGRDNCDAWPKIPNHRILTLATLEGFDFDFVAATDTIANWATGIVEDGAVAISIRGGVEPAKVTRAELRRQRKRYLDDINERAEQNKMERSEQSEMVQVLEDIEDVYATRGGSPTLVDASVLVAFDGQVEDIDQAARGSAANLRVMNFRQRQALAEMMLCSHVRANPNLHDMPSQVVAASGIQSLSTVGDPTGALVGFTERDRQPAYVSPTAASAGDAAPLFLNVGATGSGKTQVLLWKATQYAKMGGPQVIIDPKALALDTRIPTPRGWTTMGDVKVGDTVIGRDGQPCNVVHKSRIFTAAETHLYEFVLDDGQVIKADNNHMWVVSGVRDGQYGELTERLTTDLLRGKAEGAGFDGWAIPVPAAAVFPHAELDREPYTLGYLLSFNGAHGIPAEYLRSSSEQRLDLLRGLMDDKGTAGDGHYRLPVNEQLAPDVLDLIRSLGIKAAHQDGEIHFNTSLQIRGGQAEEDLIPAESGYLLIREIRPVEAEDAQCIRVDSPDHTYLVEGYVVTHNTGSDHSPAVLMAGGQVASLDDLKESDGIFDPIRFSLRPEVGVELAATMLASIDPWSGRGREFEVPLYNALAYGVSVRGAKCVGQALKFALEDKKASPELCDPVFSLADASPMFRACVGMDPRSQGLRVAEGITLIKVGDTHLDLPEPGALDKATLMQKVSMALVRMMVFGSAMALTGRGGAIHLDEAWVFLGAGKSEVERLGRLARSQNVLPELYTQRASDPLNAGLAGYISRGLILPIEDEDEARAALKLFKLEDTPERMGRITAKSTIGQGESIAPNWNSMRALREAGTGRVLRGAVAYYIDLAGRAVPVEIKLPVAFLKITSTTPADIEARQKEDAELKARANAAL